MIRQGLIMKGTKHVHVVVGVADSLSPTSPRGAKKRRRLYASGMQEAQPQLNLTEA
jgi:hypothetical protein